MLPFVFRAIRNSFACEITELEEAVGERADGQNERAELASDSRRHERKQTVAENLPPSDSITPELMSRIEESRIEGIVIEF
jgi:hypothetical protein